MNIREALMTEHSKAQALKVAAMATGSAKQFSQLVECFRSSDVMLAQRAAWALTWAAREKPRMVIPHLDSIVTMIETPAVHDAVTRCALSILEYVQIPEELQGRVMNACFGFVEEPGHPPAFKAYSLTVLWNLSNFYPEIRPELKLLIESNWDNESPAFKSRARKILHSMGSNPARI